MLAPILIRLLNLAKEDIGSTLHLADGQSMFSLPLIGKIKLLPDSITSNSAALFLSEAHFKETMFMEDCLKDKPFISFSIFLNIIFGSKVIHQVAADLDCVVLVFQIIHVDELNFDLCH